MAGEPATRSGLPFVKMHGLGNDYVYVDVFDPATRALVVDAVALARRVSDRHTGIGADGLILIGPSNTAAARMEMYNADGSRAEMCGNGLRCVARYLSDAAHATGDVLEIETDAGVLGAWLHRKAGAVVAVTIDLGPPRFAPREIPLSVDAPEPVRLEVEAEGRSFEVTCLSMGNPHGVVFVPDVAHAPVGTWGPALERHPLFPRRANIEFVERVDATHLRQRTWERGSGETKACGTGAGAVCVASHLAGLTSRAVAIELAGGVAELEWRESDGCVHLTGPAVETFRGTFWL